MRYERRHLALQHFDLHPYNYRTLQQHNNNNKKNKAAVILYIRFGWCFSVWHCFVFIDAFIQKDDLKMEKAMPSKKYKRLHIFFSPSSKVNNRTTSTFIYFASPISLSLHLVHTARTSLFHIHFFFSFVFREIPKNSITQFKLPLKVVRFNLQSSYITATR